MTKEIIPIFYSCDDNFVKYMIVSLHSIIKHADPERKYRVYVLHTDISEEMKTEMLKMQKDNVEVEFCHVGDYIKKVSDALPLRHYYTKTTYFRLFIADMFPQYKKVIYIDSDTVVRTDISKLYDTDILDNYVGACHEQAMLQVDVYGTYVERVLGISRHTYFNAGIMLINCAAWREVGLFDKFIKLLGEYNFTVTQDEDYLNVLCKDRVFWLDTRWNTSVVEGFEYPYDADSEAYIIHYIMVNKPWHYEKCRCADVFWEYASETAVCAMLKDELAAYTESDRERDRLSAENLYQMAIDETNKEDNYLNLLNKKRESGRVEVIRKIEEYESAGKFDTDVEDDPPSRELMPHEIDYLRRSPIAKLKTYIAYLKAKKFLGYITESGLMRIRKINGIENLSALNSGAIITCNHFNAFDSFALHAAYLESGHKKRKLYRVIREGNYTSFPGFYGYLMRNFYTLPLSSNMQTMKKFSKATETLLAEGNFIIVYPEQSMWWNYRKPKPLKPGAYSMALKNDVPILPCFITMRDSDTLGDDGFPIQEYTINIAEPIYPDKSLYRKECIADMMEKNSAVWKDIYEREYRIPLVR